MMDSLNSDTTARESQLETDQKKTNGSMEALEPEFVSEVEPERPAKFTKWRLEEPYRTELSKSDDPWDKCFKRMRTIDDEMCRGWREEIDTLLIFAGLFSATVTAFTVESYQWLQETPQDTLSRLQLRSLLSDVPQVDDLAPETFNLSSSVVCINTLWFSSLTLALTSVLVGILCKQWLSEYQRYENLTGEQSFIIRELRYKGLQGWKVPMIISSIPLLLQAALILFLTGLLVLLWSLQKTVASIITVIVGITFICLAMTSILPSLQYIYPKFSTQCAYKSSQSWLLFLVSIAWLPGESWVGVDLWEVEHLDKDNRVSGLWRFYEMFSGQIEAVRNIYHCLAEAVAASNDVPSSENPRHLNSLASDFVEHLKVPLYNDGAPVVEPYDIYAPDPSGPRSGSKRLPILQDILQEQFRPDIRTPLTDLRRYKRRNFPPTRLKRRIDTHWLEERALAYFLRQHIHMADPFLFHRHAEHCVRLLDNFWTTPTLLTFFLQELRDSILVVGPGLDWDNAVASHLIGSFSYLFAEGNLPNDCVRMFWRTILPSLTASHSRKPFDRSPYTLCRSIQDWLLGSSEYYTRIKRMGGCVNMLHRICWESWDSMTPDETRDVRSLIRCVLELCESDSLVSGLNVFSSGCLPMLRWYIQVDPDHESAT